MSDATIADVGEVDGIYLGIRDGLHYFCAEDGHLLALPTLPRLGLRLAGLEGHHVRVYPGGWRVSSSPWPEPGHHDEDPRVEPPG